MICRNTMHSFRNRQSQEIRQSVFHIYDPNDTQKTLSSKTSSKHCHFLTRKIITMVLNVNAHGHLPPQLWLFPHPVFLKAQNLPLMPGVRTCTKNIYPQCRKTGRVTKKSSILWSLTHLNFSTKNFPWLKRSKHRR